MNFHKLLVACKRNPQDFLTHISRQRPGWMVTLDSYCERQVEHTTRCSTCYLYTIYHYVINRFVALFAWEKLCLNTQSIDTNNMFK